MAAEITNEVVADDSTSVYLADQKVVEGDGLLDDDKRWLYYVHNTLDVVVLLECREEGYISIDPGKRTRINQLLNVDDEDPRPEYNVGMSYPHGGAMTFVFTRASLQKTGDGFYIEIKVRGRQKGEKVYLSKMSPMKWDSFLNYTIKSDRIEVYNSGRIFDYPLFHCDLKEAPRISAESDNQ